MEVRTNHDHQNLYCCYCKERINIGEKFAVVKEEIYGGEIVKKPYHLNETCTPAKDDLEDDIYIGEE